MSNYIAVQLDRKGIAEMSCIAGVGGNVKSLVRTAVWGEKLLQLTGARWPVQKPVFRIIPLFLLYTWNCLHWG